LSGDFDLNKGQANVVANISSVDEALSGSISMDMNSVSLTSSGSTFDKIPAAKDALSSIDAITAKAILSGNLDEPGVAITSNLDDILSNVLNKALEGQIAEYKKELTGKLETMLQEEMGEAGDIKSDYLGMSDDIAGAEGLLDGLLGGL